MPYLFDVVDFTHSDSEALKEHIEQFGQSIYERNFNSSKSHSADG
jgi:hypothetical protein